MQRESAEIAQELASRSKAQELHDNHRCLLRELEELRADLLEAQKQAVRYYLELEAARAELAEIKGRSTS